jgi:nickel transport protein
LEPRHATRAAWLLFAAVAALAPGAPRAHEVLHEVERNRAVALRAYFSDGDVLAHAQYQVYSPGDPGNPFQEGRTDRDGWLAFVPATPGAWRVKVVDETGHGLHFVVEAPPASAAGVASRGAAPASAAPFVLRPVIGLAAIAAVFGVLVAVYRRRGNGTMTPAGRVAGVPERPLGAQTTGPPERL